MKSRAIVHGGWTTSARGMAGMVALFVRRGPGGAGTRAAEAVSFAALLSWEPGGPMSRLSGRAAVFVALCLALSCGADAERRAPGLRSTPIAHAAPPADLEGAAARIVEPELPADVTP